MEKRSLYGIAVIILAITVVSSLTLYQKYQYYESEGSVYAFVVRTLAIKELGNDYTKSEFNNFIGRMLHEDNKNLADYKVFFEWDKIHDAERLYLKSCIAVLLMGLILVSIPIYFLFRKSKIQEKRLQE